MLLFFLASLDAFQFRRNCLVNSRISLPSNIAAKKRHNSGNTLSFLHHLRISLSPAFLQPETADQKKKITEAFTDGGQVVSVLSYFANGVPTQIQFAQLGPATQHVLQLLHTHKSRENPTEEIFCYFFWGVVVVGGVHQVMIQVSTLRLRRRLLRGKYDAYLWDY